MRNKWLNIARRDPAISLNSVQKAPEASTSNNAGGYAGNRLNVEESGLTSLNLDSDDERTEHDVGESEQRVHYTRRSHSGRLWLSGGAGNAGSLLPETPAHSLQQELLMDLHEISDKIQNFYPSALGKQFTITFKGEDGDKNEYIFTSSSELRRSGECHSGLHCDECGSDIVGFRYKCVSCADYDLCSACEALGTHADHLMMRIAKPVKLKLLQRWCEAMKTAVLTITDEMSCSPAESNAGPEIPVGPIHSTPMLNTVKTPKDKGKTHEEETTQPPRMREKRKMFEKENGAIKKIHGESGTRSKIDASEGDGTSEVRLPLKKEQRNKNFTDSYSSFAETEPAVQVDHVKVEGPDPLGTVSDTEDSISSPLPQISPKTKKAMKYREEDEIVDDENESHSDDDPNNDDSRNYQDLEIKFDAAETSEDSNFNLPDDQDDGANSDSSTESLNRVGSQKGDTVSTEDNQQRKKQRPSTSEEKPGKGKRNKIRRLKNFCYYCRELVSNFSRHLLRNHSAEAEVKKILSLPRKSKERKDLCTDLRKRGNFIQNSKKGCQKPMKSSTLVDKGDYLPCVHCLGYYARKHLWKHLRNCKKNHTNNSSNSQSDAQNLLVSHMKIDTNLRHKVFPRMRPDKISLTAKMDALICAFGAECIKIHSEKHYINVVSRKMRELAKVLIEVQKVEANIKSLFEMLKPQYYDTIVEAVKKISKYNDAKNKFETPTVAVNIGASIRRCCDIALTYVMKKEEPYVQRADGEADLKALKELINAKWKLDMSIQAADSLNFIKWDKITLIPLVEDVKKLREHLTATSQSAATELRSSCTEEAYTKLLEAVYCRVLLLNRRYPGEIQRILLSDYTESWDTGEKCEELKGALVLTEQILAKSCKSLVICSNRNRGVPVLFSCDVQEDIKLLLEKRDQFVSSDNPFVFGEPRGLKPISGYRIFEKYVKSCAAKHSDAIITVRLRKHLATLTQIFSMSESEIDQLSNFMGLVTGVRKALQPDDVLLAAKICKLFMLVEQGKGSEHKGKTLDEINLDLEEEILGEASDDEVDLFETVFPSCSQNENAKPSQRIKAKSVMKRRQLVPWTDEQKNEALAFFEKHIKTKRPPKRYECDLLIGRNPELFHNKNWLKLKVFIQNVYSKKLKTDFS